MKCSKPVLWTETIKFTDVLPNDPRRLLITDICYAGSDDVVHLDGEGGSAPYMYSARGLQLHPGLWLAEADAMDDWDVRCYRSRIRLKDYDMLVKPTLEMRNQGVDSGRVSYVFAKPGDTDVYDSFLSYKLAPEQMIWVRNEYGYYRSPQVKKTWRSATTDQEMQRGFVTATTQSGDGDGGYPVRLVFAGDLLIEAETWFLWDGDDEEEQDD